MLGGRRFGAAESRRFEAWGGAAYIGFGSLGRGFGTLRKMRRELALRTVGVAEGHGTRRGSRPPAGR